MTSLALATELVRLSSILFRDLKHLLFYDNKTRKFHFNFNNKTYKHAPMQLNKNTK